MKIHKTNPYFYRLALTIGYGPIGNFEKVNKLAEEWELLNIKNLKTMARYRSRGRRRGRGRTKRLNTYFIPRGGIRL